MKKIGILLMTILLLIGCENTKNTPVNKVESFLGSYQKLDSSVLQELNHIIKKDNILTNNQKKEYQILLEKQYQNLSYKILKEQIEKDKATVEVKIEVLDYATKIEKAKQYYLDHPEEFSYSDDNIEKEESFIDYKLKEMKKASDKKQYNIIFYLQKKEGVWILEEITEEDRQKIHGLY